MSVSGHDHFKQECHCGAGPDFALRATCPVQAHREDPHGVKAARHVALNDFVPVKHTDTLEATVASSKYEKLGIELGRMLEGKQAAYGDSFSKAGKMMAILYPEGIPLLKLGDALTIVRVLDKLFRIATDKDAFGESPWKDIAGYAMLSVVRAEEGKAAIPASFETRIPASFDHSSVCGISHPIFHQHCELPLGHSKSGLNIEHRSGLGTCWST